MTFPESNAYPMMPDKATLKEYGKVAIQNGLTKRELFAAMAMQSIITSGEVFNTYSVEHIAHLSCNQADALIAELNKEVQS